MISDSLVYLVKVALCLAVFYLFFKWTLSRDTFYRFNRIVLLAGTAAAFVLPVWVLTRVCELPETVVSPVLPQPAATGPAAVSPAANPLLEAAVRALFALWLAGAAATLLRLALSLGRVVRTIRRGRRERLSAGGVLVRVAEPVTPFSWMRYIVVSECEPADYSREILLHEQAHLRCGHSWELLCMDLLCCVEWFNPAMWLLRRELRAIHEYEADAAVLASGVDARAYQLLLVRKAVGERAFVAANSFNHDKLKNRIEMMLRKKSSRGAWAKALLLLPLLGVAVGAFAETVYRRPKGVRTHTQTVVVRGDSLTVSGVAGRPLVLVDGAEVRSLDAVDAAGIESVTVLKGDSAVAVYGARAADGVIVVTRKKSGAAGRKSKVTVRVQQDDRKVSSGGGTVEQAPDGAESAGSPQQQEETVVRVFSDGEPTVIGVASEGIDTAAVAAAVGRARVALERAKSGPERQQVLAEAQQALDRARETRQEGQEAAREALAETREARQEGFRTAREALDASREAMRSNKTAMKKALRGAPDSDATVSLPGSEIAMKKALLGEPDSDASVSMRGGEDGWVKISGGIVAADRLILVDGQRATEREMNRVLRRKVRRVEIWNASDAVARFGEEARKGAIEIETRR